MYTSLFYYIAMVCTLIAWCAQAYTTVIKKEDKLNLLLPLFYGIACIGFTIDTYLSRNVFDTVFNSVTTVLALLVFIFFVARKKR